MGVLNLGYSTGADPIKQGATFVLNVSLTSSGSTASAFNLTGYSVRAKLRKQFDSTSAVSFTAAVISAVGGTFRLTLSSTQTVSLDAGTYVYDAEIYTTGTTVYRVVEGKALVTPEVTY